MVSDIVGSGAASYTSLGGLTRIRLRQSKNPKLQQIGQELARVDARSSMLQDVINPQGFKTLDGKTKYIPGISFSNNNAIFAALRRKNEISDESLRAQIDAYAKKRAEAEAFEERSKARRNSLAEINRRNYELIKSRNKARESATAAYLERAFGLNKQKTENSPYSNAERATDEQIFGSRSGGAANYYGYSPIGDLTLRVPKSISFDWIDTDTPATQQQTISLSRYLDKSPVSSAPGSPSPTASVKYVVRLFGKGGIAVDTSTTTIADGERVPKPMGTISYISGGTRVTIDASTVTELTEAEYLTLEYTSDFTSRDTTVLQKDKDGKQVFRDVPVHDFLAVTAFDPTTNERGHISKIAITKGKIERRSSTPSETEVYRAKMSVPKESVFTSATMNVEGVFHSDGVDAAANAKDGTLLDAILEGRITLTVREFGYTQLLKVDTAKSQDNDIVLTKDNSILMSDGLDIHFEVPAAHRAANQIHAISFGDFVKP